MAVVKTVKPGGGGDFASLQAWWDWAKTQEEAEQWAECYGGGNLGPLDTTGGAAFTADAENYPRVYAAAGHRHALSWDTDKAHIDQTDEMGFMAVLLDGCAYFRIEGIAMRTEAYG